MVTTAVVAGFLGMVAFLVASVLYLLLGGAGVSAGGVGAGALILRPERTPAEDAAARRSALGRGLPPAPEAFRAKFGERLVQAGLTRREHVDLFFAVLVVSVVGGVALVVVALARTKLPPLLEWAWLGAAVAAGYLLPVLWLGQRVRARQARIAETLPDALDLMTICLEAGLAMEPAMERVGQELAKRGQPLGHELVLTSRQIQAGITRTKALHDLATRCGVAELRNLVRPLDRTAELGRGVEHLLRTASDASRTRRLQRAEGEAAKTSVKMIFPLVLFLLPPTFIVVLGPSLLQLVRGLEPLLGGG